VVIRKLGPILLLALIYTLVLIGCNGTLPGTDPPAGTGDPDPTDGIAVRSTLLGVFDSTTLSTRAFSTFAAVPAALDLIDWDPDQPGDQWVIRPTEMRIAYRYIALVTKTAYDQLNGAGQVSADDGTTLAANRATIAENAFVLLDRTASTAEPMIFDLNDTGYPISTEDFPAFDTEYSAVAAEPLFYEASIEGYGTLRAMLQDHTFGDATVTFAGDVLALLDGESTWKWVYVQAGNGFDGGSEPPWFAPAGAYSTETAYDSDDADTIADGDTGLYGPIDGDGDSTADEPSFFAATPADPAPFSELYDTFGYVSASDTFTPDFGALTTTSAFRYWVAGMESFEPVSNLMTPQFGRDTDPGGYNTTGTIAGSGEGTAGYPNAFFRIVYYEPDLHAGTEDLARVIYSASRLVDDPNYVDRATAWAEYGDYLWDSGVYMQPYLADSSIPSLMNRIILNENGSPDGVWSFSDDIAQLKIELALGSAVQFGKDRGESITDFGERFITDVPLWITDGTLYPPITGNAPLASPYSGTPLPPVTKHYGFRQNTDAGVSTSCNIDFGFITGDINVLIESLTLSQLPAYPPTVSPDPGVFDPASGNLVVTVQSTNQTAIVYYTTDGTDPEISAGGTGVGTTGSSGSYEATIDIGTTTTVVKAVCTSANGSSVSEIVTGEYRFE
jgi:hypothetical protein